MFQFKYVCNQYLIQFLSDLSLLKAEYCAEGIEKNINALEIISIFNIGFLLCIS